MSNTFFQGGEKFSTRSAPPLSYGPACFFSVAWKNARAKALWTSGESLAKPAAVKMAWILCNDAVANKLTVAFLQTTPSSGASKNSQSIFWNKYCCEAKWKSYFRVGRDYIFRKRCTVDAVHAILCDWGLRGTISLLLSICQTYHKKRNV